MRTIRPSALLLLAIVCLSGGLMECWQLGHCWAQREAARQTDAVAGETHRASCETLWMTAEAWSRLEDHPVRPGWWEVEVNGRRYDVFEATPQPGGQVLLHVRRDHLEEKFLRLARNLLVPRSGPAGSGTRRVLPFFKFCFQEPAPTWVLEPPQLRHEAVFHWQGRLSTARSLPSTPPPEPCGGWLSA